METTTETTTTKKAKAIEKKAVEVYRDQLAADVKKSLDEAIQEAWEIGKFDSMSATESTSVINALGTLAMSQEVFEPLHARVRKTQHFDIGNWRYHADVLYRGTATIAIGASAFMLMSYLTRRGMKVEGAVGASTEAAGSADPFSDTAPAYKASPRPSKHAMN